MSLCVCFSGCGHSDLAGPEGLTSEAVYLCVRVCVCVCGRGGVAAPVILLALRVLLLKRLVCVFVCVCACERENVYLCWGVCVLCVRTS